VQEFYKTLDKNGYIYTENVILPYCENDKRFLPDRFVEGECPYCHYIPARGDQCDNCGRVLDPKDLINPYCVLDHATPVLKESKSWFFDLPKLSAQLKKYVEENPNLPENARNFSLSWIRDGLKPRSITRDLTWGIKAPFKGAEKKTIYVWMDAVLGYLSAAKEWAEKNEKPNLWKKYWQDPTSRNIHFIGKDNIPFHVIVFPGLLLASQQGYNLPWEVASTEYVQFEGQRFSKSRKVGVWIDEALAVEESEYWRYALISLRPEQKDTNFTWEEFERKINTELNDALGNFIHRTITFIVTRFDGRVPSFRTDHDRHLEVLKTLKERSRMLDDRLNHFRLKDALETIVQQSRDGNKFLNENEPWQTIKKDPTVAQQTIGTAAQIVATIAIQLQPFLPQTASQIQKSLQLKKTDWRNAGENNLKPTQRILPTEPLFHKVSAQKLRSKIEEIRSAPTSETEV
jgi:methionyl-tRNA synthetase